MHCSLGSTAWSPLTTRELGRLSYKRAPMRRQVKWGHVVCLFSFSLDQMTWSCVSVAWSPRGTISLLDYSQDSNNNINDNNNNKDKGLIQITLHIVIFKSSQGVQRLKVRIYMTWLQKHGSCLSNPPQGQLHFLVHSGGQQWGGRLSITQRCVWRDPTLLLGWWQIYYLALLPSCQPCL